MRELKQLRTEKKLTQQQVADLFGISLRSYKSYENDPVKEGSLKYHYMLEKLAELNPIDEEHGVGEHADQRLVLALAPRLVGFQGHVVVSGSMEPRLSPGDVVLTRPVLPQDLQPGQVLLFPDPEGADRLVLHRLVAFDARGNDDRVGRVPVDHVRLCAVDRVAAAREGARRRRPSPRRRTWPPPGRRPRRRPRPRRAARRRRG